MVEKVVAGLLEGFAFSLAPRNEEAVRKTMMTRMNLSAPAAVESAYRSFLSRSNRKPYASTEAMQNMQRIIGLADPRVLNIRIEDLADDRFVRKLDQSGTIDRLYQSYGVE